MPEGTNPVIGPDATGVGWVFEYALVDETGQHSLADLRGFQDWHLRYWLASVPGVAEVASIGGFVKQYQVNIDPNKLAAYGIGIKDVVQAIKTSNNDVEGRLLEFSGREYMVRGRGYLTSLADIEGVSLGARSARHAGPRRVTSRRCGSGRTSGAASPNWTARARPSAASSSCALARTRCSVIDGVKAKLQEVQALAAAGRHDRAHLRPVVADRRVDQHAAAHADRGSRSSSRSSSSSSCSTSGRR